MTMKRLSRIPALLFQLRINKVRQLAITTAIRSSVIIFLLGPLTVRILAMNMKALSASSAILF